MAGIFTHPGENGHGDSAETEPEVGDPEVVPARSGVRLSASEDTERTLSKRTAAAARAALLLLKPWLAPSVHTSQ